MTAPDGRVPEVDAILASALIVPVRRVLRSQWGAEPLRARLDYVSSSRKSFLVEDIPVPCSCCGSVDRAKGADAGCLECIARHVVET